MSATAAVFIDEIRYLAEPITYTFDAPATVLYVTFHYPGVTLSTLTPGEVLLFVRLFWVKFTKFWQTHLATGIADGFDNIYPTASY